MFKSFKELVGKTIREADVCRLFGTKNHYGELQDFDDEGHLRLVFTDGTACVIVSTYGGYTGESIDEYQTKIRICNLEDKDYNKYIPIENQ